MFGVVLHRCEGEQSVVIWCDDHKDLAFLRLPGNWDANTAPPCVGDVLSFDIHEENGVRRAGNAASVSRGAYESLASVLTNATEPQHTDVSSPSRVVAFPGTLHPHNPRERETRAVRTGTR